MFSLRFFAHNSLFFAAIYGILIFLSYGRKMGLRGKRETHTKDMKLNGASTFQQVTYVLGVVKS